MSLEIPQETIARVYDGLALERDQDWVLVAGTAIEAERADTPIDETFARDMTEKRKEQAFGYDFPVEGTGPTWHSSLRIVKDILTIRALEATREDRAEAAAAVGADLPLVSAEGLERSHRLWEKGILRILDQHTSRTMWSVEFDQRAQALS